MSGFSFRGQVASAMIQVMLAAAALTGSIAFISHRLSVQRDLLQRKINLEKRNQLGRLLLLQLQDPAQINASVNKKYIADLDIQENKMLRHCLGIDFMFTEKGQAAGPPLCESSKKYPFLLVPESYSMLLPKGSKSEKINGATLKAGMNCPDRASAAPTDISCFLAGSFKGQSVGYDFNGNTGSFGPLFPLKAQVFFTPICPAPKVPEGILEDPKSIVAPSTKCHYARVLELRLELQHFFFPPSGKERAGTYGTFPKDQKLFAYRVSTMELTGQHCNPGARVFAFEGAGSVSCRCSPPYRAVLDIPFQEVTNDNPGTPRENMRGPICELKDVNCPEGFIHLGWQTVNEGMNNEYRKAICKSPTDKTGQTVRTFTKYASHSVSVSCAKNDKGHQVDGWVSKIDQRCATKLTAQVEDLPESDALQAALITFIVITGLGLAYFGLTFLFQPYFLIPFGAAFLVFYAGMEWDWYVFTESMQFQCRYKIVCAYLDPDPAAPSN